MTFTSFDRVICGPGSVTFSAVLAEMKTVVLALVGAVTEISRMPCRIFQPFEAFLQQVSCSRQMICVREDGQHVCSVGWYAGYQSM